MRSGFLQTQTVTLNVSLTPKGSAVLSSMTRTSDGPVCVRTGLSFLSRALLHLNTDWSAEKDGLELLRNMERRRERPSA
jgi:hypothetical protein